MNKKGNVFFIIAFFILVAIIVVGGFVLAAVFGVVKWTADIVYPEIDDLGMIGDTNFTEVAEYTFTPINAVINSLNWVFAILYFASIVFIVVFAVVSRVSPSRWVMPLYLVMTVLIIFLSIIMSNIYQDVLSGSGDFQQILISNSFLTYMILHSPLIFTIVLFVAGVFLYSGMNEETA